MPSRLLLPLLALPILQMPAKIETCRTPPADQAAMVVVQISDQLVDGPDAQGICMLSGPVVRSFEGPLPPDALVQVVFPCAPAAMDQFAGWWAAHNPEAVAEAGAVEVHATAGAVVAEGGRGLVLLDAPTDTPARVPGPKPEGC